MHRILQGCVSLAHRILHFQYFYCVVNHPRSYTLALQEQHDKQRHTSSWECVHILQCSLLAGKVCAYQ